MNYQGKKIPANYNKGISSLGGHITFYEDYFIFKSHKFNFKKAEIKIPYSSINCVERRSSLGVVSNAILVETKDGSCHKFVVNNREEIIDYLNKKSNNS